MAFPTIPTTGANTVLTSVTSTAGTTHTFPSLTTLDNANGDLLIAIVVLYQASATANAFGSWGGGFTEFPSGDAGTATNPSIAMACAYKFSDGTETGTFTVTSTISGRAAMVLLSVKAAHASTVPEVVFSAISTATAPDPPSLNPSGWDVEDTLWIAVAGAGQTSLTGSWGGLTSAPSSYGDYAESSIAGGDVVGAVQAAVAFRQLNGTSDDPGAFTTDTSPEIERAATIAVRGTPTQVALTGSGAVAVGGNAGMRAGLALTGKGTMAIGGSAAMTVTAPSTAVPLSGSGHIANVVEAEANAVRNLTGHGDIASAGNAGMSLTASLSGHGDIATTGRGTLDLTVGLSGAGHAAIGGTASMTVTGGAPPNPVALTGMGAIANVVAADANAVRNLSGAGHVAITGRANMRILASLAGHGDLAIGGTAAFDVESFSTTTVVVVVLKKEYAVGTSRYGHRSRGIRTPANT
jgi:hypothetical protein